MAGISCARSAFARIDLFRMFLPAALILLGFFQHWGGWYIWAAILFGLRFMRMAPVYDTTPLDPDRRFAALLALLIFLLCFMPAPISQFVTTFEPR